MNTHGIALDAQACLTRERVAQLMYQISGMAQNAPGVAVFKTE